MIRLWSWNSLIHKNRSGNLAPGSFRGSSGNLTSFYFCSENPLLNNTAGGGLKINALAIMHGHSRAVADDGYVAIACGIIFHEFAPKNVSLKKAGQ